MKARKIKELRKVVNDKSHIYNRLLMLAAKRKNLYDSFTEQCEQHIKEHQQIVNKMEYYRDKLNNVQ